MSRIDQMFTERGPTASFEFFPPKAGEAWDALFSGISAFEQLQPSFVSVTYGAGGSTRARTHDLVVRLRSETSLLPMPHLTGRGHTKAEIESILVRYAESGVNNILALRGDPPKDGDSGPGDFPHAVDLVRFINAFNESGGHPDGGFAIGIAGYPEGHHETPNLLTEMDHFHEKVDAGADFAISQLFFDNRRFLDWRERCKMAGVHIPLVAGLMPITSAGAMRRMAELAAGTLIPARLLRGVLDREQDPEMVEAFGVLWATEQSRDLLDHGVAGLHYYTLNRSRAARRVYETLGIRDSRSFMSGS
ncbi:MAG: methylenetetrahydrofolate reductase [NAD(P)H] [Phycisphaerae bacterium]|nr:methylenetetrahydrofolate reductase [NAD(P)H] [Phycisphaerae bacterium]